MAKIRPWLASVLGFAALLCLPVTPTWAQSCQSRVFSAHETTVLSAYVAYYGRPADPGGLAWWAADLQQKGGRLDAIIDAFGNSDEFRMRFGGLTNADLVNNLYRQLFSRDAEPAGLDWYTNELASGRRTLTRIALDVLYGAQGSDSDVLDNRLIVAQHYIYGAERLGSNAPSPSSTALSALISLVDARSSSAQEACSQASTLLSGGIPGEEAYEPGQPAMNTTSPTSSSASASVNIPVNVRLPSGAAVYVPGIGGSHQVTLTRETSSVVAPDYFQPGTPVIGTGPMLKLNFYGRGDASRLIPILTFPAQDTGTLNLETLVAVRRATTWVDHGMVTDHVTVLPVQADPLTRTVRVVDPMVPDSLATLYISAASVQPMATADNTTPWVGEIKYALMSFQDALNWQMQPRLVRMIPDARLADSGYRRPATSAELQSLAKKPICNMVVLVHGHNEEERDGFEPPSTIQPWLASYKRLVWDLLYKTFLDNPAYPLGCTAFYEFIYPTYRPIFSPVPTKSGERHETLGESFGRLLNAEINNNAQLKAMLSNDMRFNFSMVAHSMGGLVARAGLRHSPDSLLKRFTRLTTWGSPHHGVGLASLRYALGVGHDLRWEGARFPLQHIGQWDSYQSSVSAQMLDTPGSRDMRWDSRYKNRLRLGDVLFENTTTGFDAKETQLPDGTLFFSNNLQTFNDSEGQWMSGLLDDRFTFMFGTTTKRATAEVRSSWFPWARPTLSFGLATGIEKGHYLTNLVMVDGYGNSDGAVPTFSQRGAGLINPQGVQRIDMGDVDHEEFYGSEPAQRDISSIAKGETVAIRTHGDARFLEPVRSCPRIDARTENLGDQISIAGRFIYPLYDLANGGDGLPAKRVTRVELRPGTPQANYLPGLHGTLYADGDFEAQIPASTLAAYEGVPLYFTLVLQDGSELQATLTKPQPWAFDKVYIEDNAQQWSIASSSDGRFEATTSYTGHRYDNEEGLRFECRLTGEWQVPTSASQNFQLRLTQTVTLASAPSDPYFSMEYLSVSTPTLSDQSGNLSHIKINTVDPAYTSTTPTRGTRVLDYTQSQRTIAYSAVNTPDIYFELSHLCGGSRYIDGRGDVVPKTLIRIDYLD